MSEVSIGFSNFERSEQPPSSERSNRIGSNSRTPICRHWFVDSVAVLLVCPAHRKLALTPLSTHPSRNLWFPLVEFTSTECYDEAATRLLAQLLNIGRPCYTDLQLIHTLCLEVPKCREFVTRALFYTELDAATQKSVVCPCNSTIGSNGKATWYHYNDVSSLTNLHSPEPALVATHLDKGAKGMPQIDSSGYMEMSIQKLTSAITSGPNAELFRESGCSPDDAIQAYIDYTQQCFPSHFMNANCFSDYLTKVLSDMANLDLGSLLNAFETTRTKLHLDFFEFLAGLAALDQATPHGDFCGVVRVGYIFRFFDKSRSDDLSYHELLVFARNLLRFRSNQDGEVEPSDEKVIELVEDMYACFNIESKKPVTSSAFAQAIASVSHQELRGTSKLFRSEVSPIKQILTSPLYPPLKVKPNSKSTCTRCRAKQYTLATHSVTMLPDGTVVDPVNIGNCADVIRMPLADKIHSNKIFNKEMLVSQLIDKMREFFDKREASEWADTKKRLELVPAIKKLCAEAVEVLTNEARILRLQSPCYVFGDLHGNLNDLMAYEHIFWRMGAACFTASYLFLGNFVEHKAQSIECAVYLLCAKLIAPKQFHLLRGNQELRDGQCEASKPAGGSFYDECSAKFAESGPDVWEALNNAFDCLPLAALVDEQIFCVHGGIPTTVTKLDELDSAIPCPLKNPMIDCPAAWELLWNDPINQSEFDKEKTGKKTISTLPSGFLPNSKRNTAFYFGEAATETFLTVNRLSHVIRSHEVVPNGYDTHFGGKVVTVFSCSRYMGKTNESAILLVGLDNKIRPIKVDTKTA